MCNQRTLAQTLWELLQSTPGYSFINLTLMPHNRPFPSSVSDLNRFVLRFVVTDFALWQPTRWQPLSYACNHFPLRSQHVHSDATQARILEGQHCLFRGRRKTGEVRQLFRSRNARRREALAGVTATRRTTPLRSAAVFGGRTHQDQRLN